MVIPLAVTLFSTSARAGLKRGSSAASGTP